MSRLTSRGFTLLELLLVLALLATLVGLTGLSFGHDPQRQAQQEASLFRQMLQLARQRAVLEGAPFGVWVEGQEYRLYRRSQQSWEPAGEPRDTGLRLLLLLDGQLPAQDGEPQLLIHENDEHSVFSLHFHQDVERLASVSSDGLNDPWLE
ncbi:prepilin-type N-terminal cleavage/methylation domain-containing protein [Pseudomonas fakonensis]|uniref:Prepilin-type N-terminal cleavage/methylation domain-containing protein n=1 Tax=Pseudomonas fakonensis TaxID=2842355 RepID=A0ABX8N622_9PSED|nr:prepilin-type N-terminal cleavage/methylation domain-containing protein [Pseudomonas fakonensis]QXH51206.1 prepilin-type N-terminal cleavage/methylation domain-containing protein [Pseudomonas fakonensis]